MSGKIALITDKHLNRHPSDVALLSRDLFWM